MKIASAEVKNIKTVSELRRFLARMLSKIDGGLKVTDFNFSVSIQKNGFKTGD